LGGRPGPQFAGIARGKTFDDQETCRRPWFWKVKTDRRAWRSGCRRRIAAPTGLPLRTGPLVSAVIVGFRAALAGSRAHTLGPTRPQVIVVDKLPGWDRLLAAEYPDVILRTSPSNPFSN
jgi:hypothetical protein